MQLDGRALMAYAAASNPFDGTNLGVARFLGMDFTISGPSSGARRTPLTFTGTFDSQATGSILAALWSFGDGSFTLSPGGPGGTVLQATHAYDRPGTYTVSLMVLFPPGGSWSLRTR
jgi:PKD repeat protein